MRIAVLDDCQEALDFYGRKIEMEFLQQKQRVQLGYFSCASDFYSEEESWDVLFTDIEMPEQDGISFAVELRKQMPDLIIVFFSEHDSYVWDSFSAGAIHFMRKKYFELEVSDVVSRCIAAYESRHQALVLKLGLRVLTYEMKDIIYVEADKKNIVLHMISGEVRLKLRLSDVEQELLAAKFLKIHRSYLVNYRYIKELSTKHVELETGVQLPISKYRTAEVRSQYLFYLE